MGNNPLDPATENNYKCVVLDASNALYRNVLGLDGEDIPLISPESLQLLIIEIENAGWPVHAAMKKATYHYAVTKGNLGDKSKGLLVSLITSLKVSLVDAEDDDPFIINAAISRNGWLVSKDRFGKWKEKFPELAQEIDARRLDFQWVGERPIISGLPVSASLKGEAGETEVHITNGADPVDDVKERRTLASEAVLSYLASGEKVPIPNVHCELGTKFLNLPRGQFTEWPKGWASELNEFLGYPLDMKLKALLIELLGERISFDQHRVWIK